MPQGYGLGMKLWYLAVPGTDLSQCRITAQGVQVIVTVDAWLHEAVRPASGNGDFVIAESIHLRSRALTVSLLALCLVYLYLKIRRKTQVSPMPREARKPSWTWTLSEFHFELHFTEVGLLCPWCWSWLPSRWLLINVTLCRPPAYLNSTSSIFPQARTPVHQVSLEKQLTEAQTITAINRKTLKLKTQKGNEQTV